MANVKPAGNLNRQMSRQQGRSVNIRGQYAVNSGASPPKGVNTKGRQVAATRGKLGQHNARVRKGTST